MIARGPSPTGVASSAAAGSAQLTAGVQDPAGKRRAGRYRPSPHSLRNRLGRSAWGAVWILLFRPSPKPLHAWRRWLLRLFGARIADTAVIHPSARIWCPWNLSMDRHACLSGHVDCYNVDTVEIGACATVSQYAFLCTAGHDIDCPVMRLTTSPIRVEAHAWVAADAFIAPGVTVGEGAVVGARSSVFRSVPAWTVVAGNPARALRSRSRAVADHERTRESCR